MPSGAKARPILSVNVRAEARTLQGTRTYLRGFRACVRTSFPIKALSLPQILGAPHLARFSRDVGYHSPIFVTFKLLGALSFGFILRGAAVEIRGIPYLAKNERDMGHPELVCRDRMQIHSSHADTQEGV
jgi:hypothetical protein